MREQIISVVRLFLFLTLVLLCLAAALGVAALDRLPKMAAEKFGPPGAQLSTQQRVVYAFRLLSNEASLTQPLDPNGQTRSFTVVLGESVNTIALRLEQERLIQNADVFRTYLVYAGLDTGVQAGRYEISPSMTTIDIARKLQDAAPEEVTFNILPGWRVEEIAGLLPTSGLTVTPDAFLQVVRNPPAEILPPGFPPLDTLEGFLLPGSYTIRRGTTAREMAALFLARFDEVVTAELREGFAEQGLDLREAVTLASIVQRESMVTDEQPLIASVFYNRLAIGMRLESDPTAQYALGYQMNSQSWWKHPVLLNDLQVNSRYNTYRYAGLPPGPICNPGIEALRAVAYPSESGYYYFRAQCDGSGRHFFAVTFEEHLQNACR